jgi:ribonuclease HII
MIIATEINRIKLPDFSIEENCPGVVAGIDEAGRGPLAGPVVAACIILNRKNYPKQLNDSKKLSEKKRAEIFKELQNSAQFGIGIIDEKIIDKVNILNATKLAMKGAFENLCKKYNIEPDMVIVDGNFIPQISCLAQPIIKGDSKSLSIAAASIIAKETRDQIMTKLDKEFPNYNWAKNKGYPTKLHFDKIVEFGISKYHRQSFTLKKNAHY